MPRRCGRALLDAARLLERVEQQTALVGADELVEVRAARRGTRAARGTLRRSISAGGSRSSPMRGPRQSATARSITFSSSRTLPGKA